MWFIHLQPKRLQFLEPNLHSVTKLKLDLCVSKTETESVTLLLQLCLLFTSYYPHKFRA